MTKKQFVGLCFLICFLFSVYMYVSVGGEEQANVFWVFPCMFFFLSIIIVAVCRYNIVYNIFLALIFVVAFAFWLITILDLYAISAMIVDLILFVIGIVYHKKKYK